MKVAVLDLATVFAKLFKPTASSSSSPSYSPAPGAPPPKVQPLLAVSASPTGAPFLPVRYTALACAGGASLTTVAAASRAFPGGSGVGAAAPKPLATGSCVSGSSSPRSAREPGAWAAPASKPLLFVTLPDIGEEGAPDADPQEETAAPRKGLSKGLVDHHFQAKNEYCLPAPFTKSVQEAIDNYSLASVSSLSQSGQTTPTDLNNSWSGIQSYTTSPSTERSSVYSWGDDEFDKANTQRVHQLFWDVDEMLFEGKVSSQTEILKTECKDWTNRSLHLRILGKQLLFPKDEGFQHYQSRSSSSVYSKSVPSLSEINTSMRELCISGSKLVPAAFPVHKTFSSKLTEISLPDSPGYSFLEEEIYDAEGKMEEYFAFDKKEIDDEGLEQRNAQLAQKQIKHGIPPVSPNSCIKDAVTAEVFDQIWKNVIKILEELIRKYWESSITENFKHTEKSKVTGHKLSHIPPSRAMVDTSSVPPSRGSEVRSFGLHFGQSQAHRFSSSSHGNLNGVMTIQAKPLQQRHSSFIEKHEQEDKPQGVGSSINSAKNRGGRMTDSNVSSLPRVLPGSSKKTVGHRRLPSIAQDQLRLKTPNVYSDEVLRGTKLCTALDRLPSPFTPAVRNKLPPINSDIIDQYLSVPGLRLSFHRGKHLHSRISSAVPHGLERRPHRERTVLIDQFSRPNTTHTFRSDTPQKRSLTSMDLANQLWTGQGVVTGSQFHARSFQKNPSLSRRRFQVA
ncbi:protein FAM149A isoform X1 [Pituophis catenifer annectens]|uniref:protein FAM149A isoform X1 n=1 Tax=Pituophis catenifer annectens TaxID=94852 RepID=UPI0039952323